MSTPNALGLKETSYPWRPAMRVALSVVLGLLLVGMVTWRFLPYYKYSTLEEAVAQKRVVVGMNRGQVLKSWGAPYKIDVTYTDTGVRRELWVFEDWIDSATVKHRYLYFEEDALVGGWY
ncbi:MAG: hypothetical protein E6K62_09235 [Nitrospirae bacterium]|nr:MAG: hypothetical protein E6K62_09235 [Nitrospirota bacterium]